MVTRNGFRIASLCFTLALILRLGILFGTGVHKEHDRFEMASVGVTFAHTGQIANAYMAMPTGPTAHVAPLYPMMIGVVYWLFGEGETGETIKQILACCVSSARAALLVLLVLAFGLSTGHAWAAGITSAIYIGAFETELKGDWEGPMAANVLIVLVLWGYHLAWRRIPSPLAALGYGLAWGVALLISPSLLPVGVGLAAVAGFALVKKSPRALAAVLVCFAAGTALALSPWIIRNYMALGGFVWGRDNFGLELSLSNGPGAHWSNPLNRPRIFSMHPSRYRPATEKLLAQGELAFNADRKREAEEWIGSHPGEFATLTLQRFVHFWFPSGRNRAHQLVLAGFTLLAFAGLFILWRKDNPAFPMTLIIWIMYPLAYYVIQWSSRYRQPIDWTLVLCVSVAVYEGYRWTRRKVAV